MSSPNNEPDTVTAIPNTTAASAAQYVASNFAGGAYRPFNGDSAGKDAQ
ncbi:hypothetical protein [Streptomyces sp. SCL15-4]|nr:hypothetical protein [Streptomyces sp. SCL15-4]